MILNDIVQAYIRTYVILLSIYLFKQERVISKTRKRKRTQYICIVLIHIIIYVTPGPIECVYEVGV